MREQKEDQIRHMQVEFEGYFDLRDLDECTGEGEEKSDWGAHRVEHNSYPTSSLQLNMGRPVALRCFPLFWLFLVILGPETPKSGKNLKSIHFSISGPTFGKKSLKLTFLTN